MNVNILKAGFIQSSQRESKTKKRSKIWKDRITRDSKIYLKCEPEDKREILHKGEKET